MERIAIFGLGNVGRALLRALHRVRGGARLVLLADSKSAWVEPIESRQGIDPAVALSLLAGPASGRRWTHAREQGDAGRLLDLARATILVELTPTNLEDGTPAVPDVLAALDRGIPVVTAAKSHQRSREVLREVLAHADGLPFLDHAATLAGIPVTEMTAGLGFEPTKIEGVLNGTTNYILKRLAEGAAFQTALDEAIARGFAERNWRYDLEGNDVAVKLVGLARHLMGEVTGATDAKLEGDASLGLERGIVGVTPALIADLARKGKKLKLIGEVSRGPDGKVAARVGPRVLDQDDPFARVDGFQNVVRIEGLMNGTRMELVLRGPGAGADETASRVLGNLNHLIQVLAWRRGLGGLVGRGST